MFFIVHLGVALAILGATFLYVSHPRQRSGGLETFLLAAMLSLVILVAGACGAAFTALFNTQWCYAAVDVSAVLLLWRALR